MYIILGKTGYIAQSFIDELNSRKIEHKAYSRADFDYTDYEEFCNFIDLNWINLTKGSRIINCAGYTGKPNVDACERNKDKAIMGNVVLPTMLSGVCRSRGILLAHISSGCIYNGDHNFTEEDEPNFDFNNGSFYSGTKALAEESIKDNQLAYIFRLRIPFNEEASLRNYITKMINYDELVDVRNSFSHKGDFVKYCVDLMEIGAPFGIYNVVNKGNATTREVVDLIKYHLKDKLRIKMPDKEFKFFNNYGTFERTVLTPRSSCTLSTEKLEKCIQVRTVQEALSDALEKYEIK
jgi:UDP-glucose 4,6-dehydratase